MTAHPVLSGGKLTQLIQIYSFFDASLYPCFELGDEK